MPVAWPYLPLEITTSTRSNGSEITRNLRSGPQRCPRKKDLNNIALKWRQNTGLPGATCFGPVVIYLPYPTTYSRMERTLWKKFGINTEEIEFSRW